MGKGQGRANVPDDQASLYLTPLIVVMYIRSYVPNASHFRGPTSRMHYEQVDCIIKREPDVIKLV